MVLEPAQHGLGVVELRRVHPTEILDAGAAVVEGCLEISHELVRDRQSDERAASMLDEVRTLGDRAQQLANFADERRRRILLLRTSRVERVRERDGDELAGLLGRGLR